MLRRWRVAATVVALSLTAAACSNSDSTPAAAPENVAPGSGDGGRTVNKSAHKAADKAPPTQPTDATAEATSVSTLFPIGTSGIIDTPEGLVTTGAPQPTIAPGYSPYETSTTVVGYLLEGEQDVDVFANATDATPSQTISRINNRTLPFVVVGNTPDRLYVQLPARPNGSMGWIDKTKLDLRRNDYRIEVRLSAYELVLFERNQPVRTVKIGIGDDETPTPDGVYYTLYTGKPKEPNTVYGAFVIGLSGFSEVLEDFKGGEARLGLHGTNRPDRLGSNVSKGCIRMADEDVTFLVDRLPLGTPVKVLA
jgi:lipoprotein-anchoring transpeptidase ErfK/SrfK